MNARVKKVAIAIVKIAVLAGILEYARRQSQFDDEIAVATTAEGPAAPIVLSAVDGRNVEIPAGARLPVRDEASGGPGRTVYRVEAPGGMRVDIPASDVQGGVGAPPEGARFALLPGLRSLFAHLDLGRLGLAFLVFGPPLFLMAVRLRILLASSDIHIPFFTLVRLHYLGFFFNSFMPGGAGGDIIKAYYLARHCSQKAEAATIVVIDRAVGMVGLLVMAGAVVLFDYRHMHGIALQIGALSLALTAGIFLFFSATFRKLIRYDWFIAKLPQADVAKRVDAALFTLRARKGRVAAALALTIFLQLVEVAGVALAGSALGLERARAAHYLAFVPIAYLTNALPISFGGIGLMEGAFLKLFRDAGVATATQGFMLGVLARLLVVGWSLVGALSAIFPPKDARLDVARVARAAGARAAGDV